MLWIKHLREEIRKGLLVTLMLHRCLVAKLCPTLYNPMNCSTPPLYPRVCSNTCPLSRWCHPTISSSFAHISSCPQSFPATGSFPVSQLFTSGCQSIGPSASASVLSKKIQGWFSLGMTHLISLLSRGLSRVFSSTVVQKCQFKCQFFGAQPSLWSNLPMHTWLLGKKHNFDYMDLCQQSNVSAF